MSEDTFSGCNAEKIIVGKETDPVIPAGCFGSTRSLKELHIMSRKSLYGDRCRGDIPGYACLTTEKIK